MHSFSNTRNMSEQSPASPINLYVERMYYLTPCARLSISYSVPEILNRELAGQVHFLRVEEKAIAVRHPRQELPNALEAHNILVDVLDSERPAAARSLASDRPAVLVDALAI